jgi:hypothetical protein
MEDPEITVFITRQKILVTNSRASGVLTTDLVLILITLFDFLVLLISFWDETFSSSSVDRLSSMMLSLPP